METILGTKLLKGMEMNLPFSIFFCGCKQSKFLHIVFYGCKVTYSVLNDKMM